MILRCATVFCKLAVVWVVMMLRENLTERAPKCRAYYKASKASLER